jgi:signal transduction histidine kinase/DNA-binding response OmpR family regulator/streptogramin lyase
MVRAFYQDNDGMVWIGALGRLYKYDPASSSPAHLYEILPQNEASDWRRLVNTIEEDDNGRLWIGTLSYLVQFDKQTTTSRVVRTNYNEPSKILNGQMTSIFLDHKNVLWLASNGYGIYKYRSSSEAVTSFQIEDPNEKFVGVRAITQDHSGHVWFTSRSRSLIYRIDRDTATYKEYRFAVPDYSYNSLLTDKTGMLWLSSGLDVIQFDPQTTRILWRLDMPEFAESEANGYYLALQGDTFLWLVDENLDYIKRLDIVSKELQSFESQRSTHGDAKCVYVDTQQRLWIGCEKGLLLFDARTKDIESDVPVNNLCTEIYAIQPDPDNQEILWIGSRECGLIEFNTETNEINQYQNNLDASSPSVYGFLMDINGLIWFVSDGGIYSFDRQTKLFKRYGMSKSLFSTGIYHSAMYKNNTGELFFGGPNGVLVFHPQDVVRKEALPPRVILSQLEINSRPVSVAEQNSPLTAPLYETDRIELNHKQRNFTVTFTVDDFVNPEQNQFTWLLHGFEENWHPTSGIRRAVYTNVPYGAYQLEIKARNADDVWSTQSRILTIIISPPWWRTWWAVLIWMGLAGLFMWRSITFLIERRELVHNFKNERQRADLLKQVDDLKTRFFDYISHEFRTPLSMILSPVDELENLATDTHTKGRLALIRSNANVLLELVNQILELSKIDAQKYPVKLVLGDIVSFVDKNITLFSSHAQHKKIELMFEAEPEEMNAYYDPDMLTKILNNLLSNAVKFTPDGGQIVVSLHRIRADQPGDESIISLTVKDNGIGIPKDDIPTLFDRFSHANKQVKRPGQGIGLGLSFVKELLRLLHSDIKVESVEGKGTTVTVLLADLKQKFKTGRHLDLMEFVSHAPLPPKRVAPPAADSLEAETAAVDEKAVRPFTVLIIEDDAKLRFYLADVLGAEFIVVQAADGKEGVDLAKTKHPDIVLCDVKMPHRDGFEVTRLLKADEHTATIPVILLTAKTDAESLQQGWQAGADDYITKPFKANQVISRIDNLLQQRTRLKKSFSTAVSLKPQEITVNPMDQQFLHDVLVIIEQHMDDEAFDVQMLARQIGLSQSQLARRLNSLLNKPTVKVIQSVRMQRAAQLLRSDCCSISEASYKVGFNNPSYFTKAFRAEFGCSPQEYVKRFKA